MGNLNNPVKYAWQAYEIGFRKNSAWVISTWYEVLNITGGFELNFILAHQVNTPTNAEELDMRITIDGRVYAYDASVIAAWNDDEDMCFSLEYRDGWDSAPILLGRATTELPALTAISAGPAELEAGPLRGHDLLIEIQDTGGPSAGLDVYVRGEYKLKERV